MGEGGTSKENEVQQKLKNFMQNEVLTLQPPTASPSIYRISKEIRNGHAKLFEPTSIPIGPLHYDEKSPAQELKKWNLKNFLNRLEEGSVDTLAEWMSSLEPKIRECYRDIDRNMPSDQLVKIMLLDGCFIMELLWSHMDENYNQGTLIGKTEKVPLLTLQQDLLKIENQLPFLVLENLANLARTRRKIKGNSNGLDLIDLALKFFSISKPENFERNCRHLLELVMNALFHKHKSFPDKIIDVGSDDSPIDAKSASELQFYYGIKFRAVDSKNMTNLEFSNGELRIPRLEIQESTLWNFLIFEMSSCQTRIFTPYVVLMDSLINNEKDVQILLDSRILASRGNDAKNLISLFNNMSATVSKKEFYFAPLIQKINEYCRSSYRPLRACYMRNIYEVRWDLLNSVLIFFLTVTQTLFSVLGYKPKG